MSEELYRHLATPCRWVVGIDEVGVGAWAGPVYMACVMVPHSFSLPCLRDSKQTSEGWRERHYEQIVEAVGSGWWFIKGHSSDYIDRRGMRETLKDLLQETVERSCKSLGPEFQRSLFVVDGEIEPVDFRVPNATLQALPKADTFVPACMAAGIIAKVWRDRYMNSIEQEDHRFVRYGFSSNKGYGTNQHSAALANYGITNEHRTSYRPVRQLLRKGAIRT